jgi:serine/threonine protein phosphatase PrpC
MGRANNGKRHKPPTPQNASKHRKVNKGGKGHSNQGFGGRKNRARGKDQGWYAVADMQGLRTYMEDTHHILIPDTEGPARDLHALFGVFDGHGGKKVSQFLKANLLNAIVDAYAKEKQAEGESERTAVERLHAILPPTFLEIDEQCLSCDRTSGSTAIVAILTNTHIVVANVGDSRGIIFRSRDRSSLSDSDTSMDSSPSDDSIEEMSDENSEMADELADEKRKKKKKKQRRKSEEGSVGKNGSWQALSVDHKPNRPDEKERVELFGGHVSIRPNDVWRLQGMLAVSRAFGDHALKTSSGGAGLIAKPEIKIFPRQESDKFFLLASDGLWDVYTNPQAAKHANGVFTQHKNSKARAAEMASALANGAFKRGSLDNITVLVVLLDQESPPGTPTPPRLLRAEEL